MKCIQPVKVGIIGSSSELGDVGRTPSVVVVEGAVVVDEVGSDVVLVVDDVEELVVLLDGGGPACTSKAPMSAVPLETRT